MTKTQLRLDAIERTLAANKRILNADEAAAYIGVSKSYLYKMTSGGVLIFSKPNGKKIYFDRLELEKFLLRNPSKAVDQLESEASTYTTISFIK
jgi:excisionase family DNA binding protein